jgi:chorismate--pyruvate lyase
MDLSTWRSSTWRSSTWHSANDDVIQQLPYQVAEWVAEFGSLTEKLSHHVDKVQLNLLKEATELPVDTESKLLGLKVGDKAQIREVTLFGPKQPWIFARTVVPVSEGSLILDLGKTPLGSILFTSSELRRLSLEVAKLSPEHRLFKKAQEECSLAEQQPYLWARRSLWANIQDEKSKKLLLLEVFLPDSPLYA